MNSSEPSSAQSRALKVFHSTSAQHSITLSCGLVLRIHFKSREEHFMEILTEASRFHCTTFTLALVGNDQDPERCSPWRKYGKRGKCAFYMYWRRRFIYRRRRKTFDRHYSLKPLLLHLRRALDFNLERLPRGLVSGSRVSSRDFQALT